jgi:hypothetical protein
MYVSIAFLSAAGFLGLHALATPHMILDTASAGFNSSTPVGIAVGSLFAVASTREVPSGRAAVEMRRARRWRVALLALMAVWGLASLLRLPPFDAGSGPERGSWPILAATALAVVLFAVSALTYARLWWRRGGLLPAAMASAMVLLAEAMVAVTVAPNWHLSWWEWHLLLLAAFVLVAWGAQQSWHEERWAALYTADTLAGRREMSILFADLKGFTTFSEAHDAAEVTQMLNAYFTVAIPAVVARHGGTIDRLIGDAIMATFNRLGDQPDHARRAAEAGLALQAETARIADAHPDSEWASTAARSSSACSAARAAAPTPSSGTPSTSPHASRARRRSEASRSPPTPWRCSPARPRSRSGRSNSRARPSPSRRSC